ncbi:MAG: cytochrome P450 [Acidimicrobiales bacterium]
MTDTGEKISFFDPETRDCPWHAYKRLRDDQPIWQDPKTGMFFMTRYEDIKAALANIEVFTNAVGSAAGLTEKAMKPTDPEELAAFEQMQREEKQLQAMYEEHGWLPAPTLDALDEPKHNELRRMFDHAFRPGRIKELDPFVEELTRDLFAAFADKGRCEFVSEYAIPLPLYTIGKQMGVPSEDMPMIKAWTDAWVQRMGLDQTFEERKWSAEREIEAQQYFQAIFERLREKPEDTVLSDLVNRVIPEWDRPLNDNELHAEMMADLFVGGSETTTNALSGGVRLLIENPDVWDKLSSDPDKYIPVFMEEVVRLEGPVQGLLRELSEEVTMHGVTMPAGSIVNMRFGAANRDERHFGDDVDEVNLERPKPKGHLAFGFGNHFCLGAPLARREMYWGFKVITDNVEEMWFIEGENDFAIAKNYFLRGLEKLNIGFTLKG